MMRPVLRPAEKIRRILRCAEDTVLIVLLLGMIGLSVAQILLRNIGGSGIIWADVLIRIMVLWVGLLGAMIAGRDDRHIRIDVLTRWLPPRIRSTVNALMKFLTSLICGIVAWHSIRFVRMEYVSGGTAFAGIPVWLCELLIPFAFTVISFRYFMLSCADFGKLFGADKERPGIIS